MQEAKSYDGIFYMKIGLLILGVLFPKAGAQVQEKTPNFSLKGESDFFFELAHLPTSVQGQTRFDFALVKAGARNFESMINWR